MSVSQIHTPPADPTKFCVNCKHCKHGKYFRAACTHPKAAKIDLVHGLIEPQCSDARLPNGQCGPGGALFTPLSDQHADFVQLGKNI